MTVINNSGQCWLECEECSEESSAFRAKEFQDMIEAAKDDGWEISNDDGIWSHICGKCCTGSDKPAETALARARRLLG